MLKKTFIKKVSILTVAVFILGNFSSLVSSANPSNNQGGLIEDILATEVVTWISTDVELSEEVLSNNFDLEEAVENMPSINDMSKEETELFNEIVDEQVSLAGLETKEEEELFAQAMTEFFDDTSDTYNDLSAAMDDVEDDFYDLENSSAYEDLTEVSFLNDLLIDNFGMVEVEAAFQVKVGVKFAGAVFNGIIGFAVGGGVGAIQAFILKKGKASAAKIFNKTIVSKLKAWGAPKLALAVGSCVTVALNYLDVGTQIAKQLDKRDKRPNNGWIDLY